MSVPLSSEVVNSTLLESVAARLDLREPNKEALELIAYRIAEHYNIDHRTDGFEGVADVATGVGKTYIMAGAIDYFAELGTRNFGVITPGRTILKKTEAQFSPGTAKSLLPNMEVEPVVVTSENFNSAEIATALENDEEVKLFIFTVQSLLKPETKAGRRTHKFQEGLGKAFYEHLQNLDDLVLFADEHHCYYSPAFSRAIRDLKPYALVGLTATPHPRTPRDLIFYRYPLAAAIADELVKSPVIVGRQDDRSDIETKLQDGIRLLELKERTIADYCAKTGEKSVNPVMLVVAKDITDADAVADVLRDPSFAGGRYADTVLVVHSDAPDEALEALDTVEDAASPVRIIVSVGMLKEGWDVKNVYVIASLRASVSEILTEQTLGRGLRLPFGHYTGIEILDTLEVVAHERYDELLRKSGVINEAFIDMRTHIEMRKNAQGQTVPVAVDTEVAVEVDNSTDGDAAAGVPGGVTITTVNDRSGKAEEEAEKAAIVLTPRSDVSELRVPRVRVREVKAEFSLADITINSYSNPYKELGERIAANPSETLRRTRLGARIIVGPDGLRRTVTETATAVDKVSSAGRQLSLEGARAELIDRILGAPIIPPKKGQRNALQPIVDAFMEGLSAKAGDKAEEILSAYLDRMAYRLIDLITTEQRKLVAKPQIDEVTEVQVFAPVRHGRAETSTDRKGAFKKSVGYEGWQRSMYAQAWFDSSTERDAANVLDEASEIDLWVRLHRNDLPIVWEEGTYNPDFIAVEKDGTHWVVEVKMDKEAEAEDVRGKRAAAQKWSNHVNAHTDGVKWRYLFVREKDVKAAKGSWPALKGMGAL